MNLNYNPCKIQFSSSSSSSLHRERSTDIQYILLNTGDSHDCALLLVRSNWMMNSIGRFEGDFSNKERQEHVFRKLTKDVIQPRPCKKNELVTKFQAVLTKANKQGPSRTSLRTNAWYTTACKFDLGSAISVWTTAIVAFYHGTCTWTQRCMRAQVWYFLFELLA